jgi:hypothetical protein
LKKYLDASDPLYEKLLSERFDMKEKPYVIYCNKCSKKIDMSNENDYWSENLMHSFSVAFGYGSRFDMDIWDFHLCEKCVLEFILTFKIAPNGHPSFDKDKESFEKWKRENRLNILFE